MYLFPNINRLHFELDRLRAIGVKGDNRLLFLNIFQYFSNLQYELPMDWSSDVQNFSLIE